LFCYGRKQLIGISRLSIVINRRKLIKLLIAVGYTSVTGCDL
jgi:hypothetical protein